MRFLSSWRILPEKLFDAKHTQFDMRYACFHEARTRSHKVTERQIMEKITQIQIGMHTEEIQLGQSGARAHANAVNNTCMN